jgi:hypothetical protein
MKMGPTKSVNASRRRPRDETNSAGLAASGQIAPSEDNLAAAEWNDHPPSPEAANKLEELLKYLQQRNGFDFQSYNPQALPAASGRAWAWSG